MHPYWIDIDSQLGVGITAASDDDALAIFEAAFGTKYRPARMRVIRDMSELEQSHVAPNIGNWFVRGIWYPLGYEDISN